MTAMISGAPLGYSCCHLQTGCKMLSKVMALLFFLPHA